MSYVIIVTGQLYLFLELLLAVGFLNFYEDKYILLFVGCNSKRVSSTGVRLVIKVNHH